MPPYLHYQDPADEEESCPQPSALPAALAASLPAMHHSQAATHHHFRSHPPLPPHPLLKLHRSAVNSPIHRAPSHGHVANISACSPCHVRASPVAQSSTPSSAADKGPSCTGPGTSSPGGSPGALDNAEEGGANGYHSKHTIDQLQLQQLRPQHADLQQQQEQQQEQQHGLMPACVSGNEGDRQRLRQVAASRGQEEPFTDEVDQADSGSEHSDLSECESAGAVGDDELLDHETDIADAEPQRLPANQPGYSAHLFPDTQHGSLPSCGLHTEQDCAVSNSEMPAHSSMVTQHLHLGALPQHFGNQSFGERQRAAAYPQQWPNQAMAPMGRHGQMQPGLGRGRREEHVSGEGSKLRQAYRGHCQQDFRCQAKSQQQVAQHGQRQNSGKAS